MTTAKRDAGDSRRVGPVVSSAHLAAGSAPALSELEFALTMSNNAFHRWMVRCMSAAGHPGMAPLDIVVLHIANHRDRVKTLADICLVLNIEDTHTVVYAIRKLEAAGLVASGKRGKEKTVAITEEGAKACAAYRDIREALLADAVASIGFDQEEISKLATLLRALSGHYDQAARAAASL